MQTALDNAAGHFRHIIATHIDLRYTPTLPFFYDETIAHAEQLNQLLLQAERKKTDDESAERTIKRPVNGILLLDKPLHMSSNQALQTSNVYLRRSKAGHTGSLDPLASGLLPICFGEATKFWLNIY